PAGPIFTMSNSGTQQLRKLTRKLRKFSPAEERPRMSLNPTLRLLPRMTVNADEPVREDRVVPPGKPRGPLYAVCRGAAAALRLDVVRPALIQGYLDGWDDKHGKPGAALAACKALERWAVVRDLLPRQIPIGVETGKPQGGHIPWSDAQVALAEKHVRPDLARAITL